METEKKPVDFSSIEVMARLTDVKIETRELVDRWLLITYDLPHNEAGDRARREFLDQARRIGATHHTDSVYLLPWTTYAEQLALQLATRGEVCVWTSQTTNEAKAKEITASYDAGLAPQVDEISERLDKISEHLSAKHFKRADQMLEKTVEMVDALEDAILRRGSAELFISLQLLRRRMKAIVTRQGGV